MQTDKLIEQLARDAKPVRRLAAPTVRFARWLGGSVLYVAVCLAVLGIRPDWRDVSASPVFWLATALLIAAAVASAWLAFCFSVPGRARDRGVRIASAVVGLIGLMILAGLAALVAASLGPVDQGWMCSVHLALVAVVPAALLLLMLRRAAPLQWLRTGLVLGVASAGVGAIALQFACCSGDPMHLVVWHVLPGLILIGLAAAVAFVCWRRA